MKIQQGHKYLVFYISAFITFYLTQEVLFGRMISFGHYYITGGSFIYFTSPLILDIISEVYGYSYAKKTLYSGLMAIIFMAIVIAIVLHAPYPSFLANTISSYNKALGYIPYTAAVGTLAIFVGQYVNAYLISKWRILAKGRYFWLRSVGSTLIGDSLTISLSFTLALTGRIPHLGIFINNIVPELVLMFLFSALGAFPAWWLTYLTKKYEQKISDTKTFNPFSELG